MRMKTGMGFIETIEQEAKRIVDGNPTHSKAWHIGLRLLEMVEEEKTTQTTNLNFWQAYQAMKHGEWVGNDEIYKGAAFSAIVEDDYLSIRTHDGRITVIIEKKYFDSTAWYIVPKSPRYKVGDRFEEIRGGGIITRRVLTREIVHVDDATQTCCVKVEQNGEHAGIHCCSYAYLDTLATKLPS